MSTSTSTPTHPTEERRKCTSTSTQNLQTPSIAPSDSASMISHSHPNSEEQPGELTPRAPSPNGNNNRPSSLHSAATTATTLTTATITGPYRGFPSEAAYLSALREWAESKKYLEPETRLIGFYGQETMEELASRARPEIGLRRKWRARKERKKGLGTGDGGRRNTVG